MKTALMMLMVLAVAAAGAATPKTAVVVEALVPNAGCKVSEGQVKNLHDRILGQIASTDRMQVVERESLGKVQKELELVDAGMTDGEAPESNRLKAASYCIYGKIVQHCADVERSGGLASIAGKIELQMRIADIESGKIVSVFSVSSAKTLTVPAADTQTDKLQREILESLSIEAAKRVVEKMHDCLFPAFVLTANSRAVTGSVGGETVAEGDVWEVYIIGEALKDPITGEVLGCDEEPVGRVTVVRPGARTTRFAYGENGDGADAAKKAILEAFKDGERMVMRRVAGQPARKRESAGLVPLY